LFWYTNSPNVVVLVHILDSREEMRYQVMDTPGLLDRPVEERNEMERLTFASLLYLPTAVIYVIDPTGLSGHLSYLLLTHLNDFYIYRREVNIASTVKRKSIS
jgi:hypothetical protein